MVSQIDQTESRLVYDKDQDPTALTAAAVSIAKEDLRRELQAQRELMSERIQRTEELVTSTYVRIGQELSRTVDALSELINQRITGLESIVNLISAALSNEPKERDELRQRLQSDISIAIENLRQIQEEKFSAISQQFEERDTRSEQEKKASKEALDAALLAQKESVSQQNDANTTAATKSETSFTKQIDQIATLIATLEKALTDRITELKERIDRGEGQGAGVDKAASSQLDDSNYRAFLESIAQAKKSAMTSQLIAVGSVLVSIIAIIVVVLMHG